MKQTFDLDTMLFNLLKGLSEVVSEISGDVYSLGERPDGSQDEDIVVNSINLTQEYLPQLGTSNINIYVSDTEVQIKKKEQRKTNRRRLKAIPTIVLKTLRAAKFDGLVMVVMNQTVSNEPSLSQHYISTRTDQVIHQKFKEAASLITLGLSQIMIGTAAPNGTVPTAALAKIGRTYKDTYKMAQDASDMTKHFEEGRSAPEVRKKAKKIPALTFPIMSPSGAFLAKCVGGSSDATKGWGFDGTEIVANVALEAEAEQGLNISIPNADAGAMINANFPAKGVFLVDFTVTPCAVSFGKAIWAKAETAK